MILIIKSIRISDGFEYDNRMINIWVDKSLSDNNLTNNDSRLPYVVNFGHDLDNSFSKYNDHPLFILNKTPYIKLNNVKWDNTFTNENHNNGLISIKRSLWSDNNGNLDTSSITHKLLNILDYGLDNNLQLNWDTDELELNKKMTLEIKLEDTIRNSVVIPHGLLDDNSTPDFNANTINDYI